MTASSALEPARLEAELCLNIIGHIPKASALAVAVSGGSDSLGLLALARRNLPADVMVCGLIVDHGLREESAEEALWVRQQVMAMGCPATILTWQGEKPTESVAQAAREARYELLADAARKLKMDAVLLGHTADDQSETCQMRIQRDGGMGLSGMPIRMRHLGMAFVRPMLAESRQRLQDYLRELGQEWVDDPSNHDRRYERVRVRQKLAKSEKHAVNLRNFAGLVGRWRGLVSTDASMFAASYVNKRDDGWFEMVWDKVWQDHPAFKWLLSHIIQCIGGKPKRPSLADCARLINKLKSGRVKRATLGGCVVELEDELLLVARELRGFPESTNLHDLPQNTSLTFDGRFQFSLRGRPLENLVLDMPGEQDLSPLEDHIGRKLTKKERSVVMSTPVVRYGAKAEVKFISLPPSLGEIDTSVHWVVFRRQISALDRFCPNSDWPLWRELEGLFST